MADLVDITPADDTAVLWHCGLAPISMRDPAAHAEATIHTNRRMPLLHQFPIKPAHHAGRLSRARNETKLMLAGAESFARRWPSPVARARALRRPAAEVGRTIMERAEHHFALAYGDHKAALKAIAARWNLPCSSSPEMARSTSRRRMGASLR